MLDPSELFPEIPNLYEFPSVHADMIFDSARVNGYKRAIESIVRKGDIVVDVGTGSGLLAFLCLNAGAARVHAIDRSPIIHWARQLAETNGYSNRIIFYEKDSRDTDIGEPADVIVSELIGHIAFEEGMVETIFDAIGRFLKADGTTIPQEVTLFAAPVFEQFVYPRCIDCWESTYGIDYSIMREKALKTSYVTEIDERDLMAKQESVFSVNFAQEIPPEMHCNRKFVILRPGIINGIAFWFDAELTDGIRISSGPWAKMHWNQCFVPVPEPFDVRAEDIVLVNFDMKLRTRKDDSFSIRVHVVKDPG